MFPSHEKGRPRINLVSLFWKMLLRCTAAGAHLLVPSSTHEHLLIPRLAHEHLLVISSLNSHGFTRKGATAVQYVCLKMSINVTGYVGTTVIANVSIFYHRIVMDGLILGIVMDGLILGIVMDGRPSVRVARL